MSTDSLATHFQQYFRIELANTPERLEQVYRIRYQVYCQEFGFEREEDCPGGLERDDYDQHSNHCLLIHRTSHMPAGCVRLVKLPNDNPAQPLPFEKFCGSSLYHETLHPRQLPRTSLCEASRLAVPATFRKRAGEFESRFGNLDAADFTEYERRTFPLLSVALFLADTALVVLTGRYHIFVMMEPKLARLLQRSGLAFTQVGELMEYHGPRAAFHITIEQALAGMKPDLREMYDFVYRSIEADFTGTNPRKEP